MLLDSKSCHSRGNLDLEIVHDHQCRDVITEGSSCRFDVGDDYLPAYRIMVSLFDQCLGECVMSHSQVKTGTLDGSVGGLL